MFHSCQGKVNQGARKILLPRTPWHYPDRHDGIGERSAFSNNSMVSREGMMMMMMGSANEKWAANGKGSHALLLANRSRGSQTRGVEIEREQFRNSSFCHSSLLTKTLTLLGHYAIKFKVANPMTESLEIDRSPYKAPCPAAAKDSIWCWVNF